MADVTADVYVIPTETPEAEGTLARDLGGGYPRGRCIPRDLERVALAREVWARYRAPNLHARVGVAVPNLRHVEYFHDHQRIERMLFDGALDPAGGILTPDADQPGLGLTLRESDAERYRRG